MISVDEARDRILAALRPTPVRNRRARQRLEPRHRSAGDRAADPAARRCVRHGRLCPSRAGRHPGRNTARDRQRARWPSVCWHCRIRPGGPPVHGQRGPAGSRRHPAAGGCNRVRRPMSESTRPSSPAAISGAPARILLPATPWSRPADALPRATSGWPPPPTTRGSPCIGDRASRSSPPATRSPCPANRSPPAASSVPIRTHWRPWCAPPAASRSYFPIAADTREAIAAVADAVLGMDLLVTTGGASVGDHDLVIESLKTRGMELDFWQIAMRPGKPLLFGKLGSVGVLGLPGNPVSALVCSILFLLPALSRLAGLPAAPPPTLQAIAGAALSANDHRADHLRATVSTDLQGRIVVTPFPVQDFGNAAAPGARRRPDPARAERSRAARRRRGRR